MSILMADLQVNLSQPAHIRFSVFTCSRRKPLEISGTGCYGLIAILVTQPTVSWHWRQHTALITTSDLVSPFFYTIGLLMEGALLLVCPLSDASTNSSSSCGILRR